LTYRVGFRRPAKTIDDAPIAGVDFIDIEADGIGQALDKAQYKSFLEITSIVATDRWTHTPERPATP